MWFLALCLIPELTPGGSSSGWGLGMFALDNLTGDFVLKNWGPHCYILNEIMRVDV